MQFTYMCGIPCITHRRWSSLCIGAQNTTFIPSLFDQQVIRPGYAVTTVTVGTNPTGLFQCSSHHMDSKEAVKRKKQLGRWETFIINVYHLEAIKKNNHSFFPNILFHCNNKTKVERNLIFKWHSYYSILGWRKSRFKCGRRMYTNTEMSDSLLFLSKRTNSKPHWNSFKLQYFKIRNYLNLKNFYIFLSRVLLR